MNIRACWLDWPQNQKGGNDMRFLMPGEPCPCCGYPIRDDVPRWKLLLLSYIAEGLSLMDAINTMAEVIELPQLGREDVDTPGKQEASASKSDSLPAAQDDAAEKREILKRLSDYRKRNGLGCLEEISKKSAHFRGDRLSTERLRMIITGDAPKMDMAEWKKIAKALDALENKTHDSSRT